MAKQQYETPRAQGIERLTAALCAKFGIPLGGWETVLSDLGGVLVDVPMDLSAVAPYLWQANVVQDLFGRPQAKIKPGQSALLEHLMQNAGMVHLVKDSVGLWLVWVAEDDEEIAETVLNWGHKVTMYVTFYRDSEENCFEIGALMLDTMHQTTTT